MKPKLIDYPLFHNPVEITNALVTVASQESRVNGLIIAFETLEPINPPATP